MVEQWPPSRKRSQFLRMAYFVQGGVLLLSLLAVWIFPISSQSLVRWEWSALLAGLLAVIPMLGLYRVSPNLRQLANDAVGDSLVACHWSDLVLVAALAGVGEELLFRGVIYESISPFNPWIAMVVSNVCFGALHAMSRNYFFVATLIGFGMHALAELTGERNLLAPMVAHAVYDWIAFRLLVGERRRHLEMQSANSPTSD